MNYFPLLPTPYSLFSGDVYCTKASVSDDMGLIEMLSDKIDYFKSKPVNIPKITILLDHGYQERKNHTGVRESLSRDYDQDSI